MDSQRDTCGGVKAVCLPAGHWGTRAICCYEKVEQIGEGTYGQVSTIPTAVCTNVNETISTVIVYKYTTVCVFFHTSTFQLLDRPWSQVSSLLSPGACLQLLSRIGFSNPTANRFFIECCKLTLSRFPQVNLCTTKSPHEFIRACTPRGGIQTHETELHKYQVRG